MVELCSGKVTILEIRIGRCGALKGGLTEVTIFKFSTRKVCTAEIGADEYRVSQFGFRQCCILQVRAVQIYILALNTIK